MGYFLLTFFACVIGALGGIGGGMIIKPALDSVGTFSLENINVLSSAVVFVMSVVSIWKMRQHLRSISARYFIYLALGALLGGALGGRVFISIKTAFGQDRLVGMVQTIILMLIIIAIFLVEWYKHYIPRREINAALPIFSLGALLGTISSFLGVGGGPYNRPTLYHLMKVSDKGAGVGSLVIILFSQAMYLSEIAFTKGFAGYDLHALPEMLIGAVLGGFIGGCIVNKVNEKMYHRLFLGILILLFSLNVWNLLRYII